MSKPSEKLPEQWHYSKSAVVQARNANYTSKQIACDCDDTCEDCEE